MGAGKLLPAHEVAAPPTTGALRVQIGAAVWLEVSHAEQASWAGQMLRTMGVDPVLSFAGSVRVFVALEPCDMRIAQLTLENWLKNRQTPAALAA